MRLRAGSSLLYPLVVAVTVGTGLLVGAGCSGGSGHPPSNGTPSPSPTPTATATPIPTTPLTVRSVIIWGARSRQTTLSNAVSGPSSGLSAIVVLQNPSTGEQLFSQTVNRDVTTGRQEYTSTDTLPAGIYNLVVRFYAGRDGQGQVVGTAAASTSLVPDTSTAVTNDGTLSTTIATFGTIQSVTIPAGQSVAVGQIKSLDLSTVADKTSILIYEPKDAQGNLIAISPGSAFVSISDATSTVSGSPSIIVSGDTVRGVAPQSASIIVKVDDAVSAATTIAVTSAITANGSFTVTPSPADVSILQSVQLTANITNDGPAGAQGVTWRILDNGDGSKGTISSTGLFTATRTEGAFIVRATSVFDPRVFVDTLVRVSSKVTVIVTPANPGPVSIKGGTLKLTSRVTNVPDGEDAGVTYSIQENNGGTITPEGLYTAPAAAGTYTVIVTSNFDTRAKTLVKIPVQSFVTFTPTGIADQTLTINGTRTFAVTVNPGITGGDTGVTFSIVTAGAASRIDSVSGTFSAGGKTETVRVRATSNFDNSKFIEFNVRVVAGNTTIGVG